MSWNLMHYGLEDRDGDGQANDYKPDAEVRAIHALIKEVRPDILVVQEMGRREVFQEFKQRLDKAGLTFPYEEFVVRGKSKDHLALLSRFPIVARYPRTNDTYTLDYARVYVSRGYLDVEIAVNEHYRFRLMAAHLKSKVFHPLGQSDMRRNEARILGQHVRKMLKKTPALNLLVVGDMNDDPNSSVLREITEKYGRVLHDLHPRDCVRDAWTLVQTKVDHHYRYDYLLASDGMLHEVMLGKTRAIRHPLTYQASDHRPLVGVFRAVE